MKKTVFGLIISIFLVDCSNDNSQENPNNETRIDLVTGINIRNSISAVPMKLGNPNINNNNRFTAFPNPPIGTLLVSSSYEISDVWILPCAVEKIFQDVDFNEILSSELYSENDIDTQSELKFLNENSTELTLDLETLEVGYYKVFVKMNGTFYWDNIFLFDGNQDINELINFWN